MTDVTPARLAELNRKIGTGPGGTDMTYIEEMQILRELQASRTTLEGVMADAARYRFLRADRRILNAMPVVREDVHRQLREEWRAVYPHGGPGAWGPTEDRHIDAAIDAAMEAQDAALTGSET